MRTALLAGLMALLAAFGSASRTASGDQTPATLQFVLDRDAGGQVFIRVPDVSLGDNVGDAMLDTGAEYSSLSARFSDGSGLVEARRIPLRTFSGRVHASLSRAAPIGIQDRYRISAPVLTMPREMTWPTDRLLAASLFPAFSVDFDRGEIAIPGSPEGLAPLPGGKRDGVFFVEMRGERRTHRFILDTGSSGSRIREDVLHDLRTADNVTESLRRYLGPGGWVLERGIVRLGGLTVGSQTMSAMTFRIVGEDDIPVRGFAGVIGLKNLTGLNWRFDNGSGRLWGRTRTSPIDGSPLVGFYARHQDETVTVTGLIEGGAAHRAGLMIGDQIVTLNGISPVGETYQEYLSVGNCSCSAQYVFQIKRDGQAMTLTADQADLF